MAWTSSSKFSGFRRKSTAPARIACTPVRKEARPLTTITGIFGYSWRNWGKRSSPSISGITTSMMMAWTACCDRVSLA